MLVGDKVQLHANITPENTTDKSVEWKSLSQDIAHVDETGMVRHLLRERTDRSNLQRQPNHKHGSHLDMHREKPL